MPGSTPTSTKEFWRRGRHHHHRHHNPPEIIRDFESLTVTKNDLTAAGKIMFIFRNIKKLRFHESVDASTLVNHIKYISGSKVIFDSNIPKILQLGLVRRRSTYQHPSDTKQLKDITIRKVSVDYYNDFIAEAKNQQLTNGEFFSRLMSNFVPMIQITDIKREMKGKKFLLVRNEKNLTISNEDLEILGGRGIIFYGIYKLTFSNNITQENFLASVIKVIQCEEVVLPRNIPRLILLSRLIHCKKIINVSK